MTSEREREIEARWEAIQSSFDNQEWGFALRDSDIDLYAITTAEYEVALANEADTAEFIASTPADIAYLLDTVRALRLQLAAVTSERDSARADYKDLTASWDEQVRQKNNLHLAIELQSDLLADALGKTTREGLSYTDMISEVKAVKAALAPFAAVGRAVIAAHAERPNSTYAGEQAFTVSGMPLTFADFAAAAQAGEKVSE